MKSNTLVKQVQCSNGSLALRLTSQTMDILLHAKNEHYTSNGF